MHPLDLLVGQWNTTGRNVPGPAEKPFEIRGTDRYEWLPGRKFLVHTVDVWMGADKVNALELIGPCSEGAERLPMNAFGSDGRHEVMHATLQGPREWSFAGDDVRAQLAIDEDGRSMTARWERRDEAGNFIPWLDMQFVKAT